MAGEGVIPIRVDATQGLNELGKVEKALTKVSQESRNTNASLLGIQTALERAVSGIEKQGRGLDTVKTSIRGLKTELQSMSTNMSSITTAVDRAVSRLKSFENVQKGVVKSATDMAAAQVSLNSALSRTITTMSQAAKETAKAAKAQTDLNAQALRAVQRSSELGASLKARVTELEKQVRALQKVKAGQDQVNTSQERAKQATAAATTGTNNLTNAFTRLRSAVLSFIAAYAGIQTLKDISKTAIHIDSLNKSFAAIQGSSAGARQEMKYVSETAERLGLDFMALAESYKGFSAATKFANMSLEESRTIFTSISEASTVLGLSAEKTKLVLMALEQMVSKGVVSMEELRRQLGDSLPGAFELGAKAMNMGLQEFNKFVASGQLLSEDFIPKFAKTVRETFAGGLAAAIETPRAAIQRLLNDITEAKRIIGSGGFLAGLKEAAVELHSYFKTDDARESLYALGKSIGEIVGFIGGLTKTVLEHKDVIVALAGVYVSVRLALMAYAKVAILVSTLTAAATGNLVAAAAGVTAFMASWYLLDKAGIGHSLSQAEKDAVKFNASVEEANQSLIAQGQALEQISAKNSRCLQDELNIKAAKEQQLAVMQKITELQNRKTPAVTASSNEKTVTSGTFLDQYADQLDNADLELIKITLDQQAFTDAINKTAPELQTLVDRINNFKKNIGSMSANEAIAEFKALSSIVNEAVQNEDVAEYSDAFVKLGADLKNLAPLISAIVDGLKEINMQVSPEEAARIKQYIEESKARESFINNYAAKSATEKKQVLNTQLDQTKTYKEQIKKILADEKELAEYTELRGYNEKGKGGQEQAAKDLTTLLTKTGHAQEYFNAQLSKGDAAAGEQKAALEKFIGSVETAKSKTEQLTLAYEELQLQMEGDEYGASIKHVDIEYQKTLAQIAKDEQKQKENWEKLSKQQQATSKDNLETIKQEADAQRDTAEKIKQRKEEQIKLNHEMEEYNTLAQLAMLQNDPKKAAEIQIQALRRQLELTKDTLENASKRAELEERIAQAVARSTMDYGKLIEMGLDKLKGENWESMVKFFEESIPNAMASVSDGMAAMMTDIIMGAKSAEDAWKDFGKSMKNMFANLLQEWLQVQMRMMFFGGTGSTNGIFGNFFGGAGGGSNIISGVFNTIFGSGSGSIAGGIGGLVGGVVEGVSGLFGTAGSGGAFDVSSVLNGIGKVFDPQTWTTIGDGLMNLPDTISGWFSSAAPQKAALESYNLVGEWGTEIATSTSVVSNAISGIASNVAMVASIYSVIQAFDTYGPKVNRNWAREDTQQAAHIGAVVGGLGGMAGGVAYGTAVGSNILPGVGTIVGAILGAALGATLHGGELREASMDMTGTMLLGGGSYGELETQALLADKYNTNTVYIMDDGSEATPWDLWNKYFSHEFADDRSDFQPDFPASWIEANDYMRAGVVGYHLGKKRDITQADKFYDENGMGVWEHTMSKEWEVYTTVGEAMIKAMTQTAAALHEYEGQLTLGLTDLGSQYGVDYGAQFKELLSGIEIQFWKEGETSWNEKSINKMSDRIAKEFETEVGYAFAQLDLSALRNDGYIIDIPENNDRILTGWHTEMMTIADIMKKDFSDLAVGTEEYIAKAEKLLWSAGFYDDGVGADSGSDTSLWSFDYEKAKREWSVYGDYENPDFKKNRDAFNELVKTLETAQLVKGFNELADALLGPDKVTDMTKAVDEALTAYEEQLQKLLDEQRMTMEGVQKIYDKYADNMITKLFTTMDQQFLNPLSTMEQNVININAQFEDFTNAIKLAGATTEQLAQAEVYHMAALDKMKQQMATAFWDDYRVRALQLIPSTDGYDSQYHVQYEQLKQSQRKELEQTIADYGDEMADDKYTYVQYKEALLKAEELAWIASYASSAFDAAKSTAQSLASSAESAISAMNSAWSSLVSGVNSAVTEARNAIKEAVDVWANSAKQTYQEAANAYLDALKSDLSKYKNILDRMNRLQSDLWTDSNLNDNPTVYGSAKYQLQNTYNKALAGDADALSDFDSLAKKFLSSSMDYSGDYGAYRDDFYSVQDMINNLRGNSSEQVEELQKEIDLIEEQLELHLNTNKSLSELKDIMVAAYAEQQRALQEQADAYLQWGFDADASAEERYRNAVAEWTALQTYLTEHQLQGLIDQDKVSTSSIVLKLEELRVAYVQAAANAADAEKQAADAAAKQKQLQDELNKAIKAIEEQNKNNKENGDLISGGSNIKPPESTGGFLGSRFSNEYDLVKAKVAQLNSTQYGGKSNWTIPEFYAVLAKGNLTLTQWYSQWGQFEGFANGGLASGLSLVGERGPELLDLRTPGRVYTNEELAMAINTPINQSFGSDSMLMSMVWLMEEQVDYLTETVYHLRRVDNTNSEMRDMQEQELYGPDQTASEFSTGKMDWR